MAKKDTALLVLNMQNDFINGSLGNPLSTKLLADINQTILFFKDSILLILPQDWHPVNHRSFTMLGGDMPSHCVAGTWGAEVAKDLFIPPYFISVRKGLSPSTEELSAFSEKKFTDYLTYAGFKKMLIVGFLTERGVLATSLDSVRAGFETVVLSDLTVGLNHAQSELAKDAMRKQGVRVENSLEFKQDFLLEHGVAF